MGEDLNSKSIADQVAYAMSVRDDGMLGASTIAKLAKDSRSKVNPYKPLSGTEIIDQLYRGRDEYNKKVTDDYNDAITAPLKPAKQTKKERQRDRAKKFSGLLDELKGVSTKAPEEVDRATKKVSLATAGITDVQGWKGGSDQLYDYYLALGGLGQGEKKGVQGFKNKEQLLRHLGFYSGKRAKELNKGKLEGKNANFLSGKEDYRNAFDKIINTINQQRTQVYNKGVKAVDTNKATALSNVDKMLGNPAGKITEAGLKKIQNNMGNKDTYAFLNNYVRLGGQLGSKVQGFLDNRGKN